MHGTPPPPRTFYLAGASSTHRLVKQRSFDLERMGLAWEYDWTTTCDPLPPPDELAMFARRDTVAARKADLFVLLAHPLGRGGAMYEAGRRGEAGGVVHVVEPDPQQIFFLLPEFVRHATWDHLLAEVWNMVAPVGTPVLYTPLGKPERACVTRAAASVYDGEASVWVNGVVGPVPLHQITRAS